MIREAEKIIVPSSLCLEMMRLMGIVRRYRDDIYIMITPPPEPTEVERDATEGSQPTLKP